MLIDLLSTDAHKIGYKEETNKSWLKCEKVPLTKAFCLTA